MDQHPPLAFTPERSDKKHVAEMIFHQGNKSGALAWGGWLYTGEHALRLEGQLLLSSGCLFLCRNMGVGLLHLLISQDHPEIQISVQNLPSFIPSSNFKNWESTLQARKAHFRSTGCVS